MEAAPTRVMLEDGEHWSKPDVIFPKTNFGVAQGFFTDIEGKADTANSPVWNYRSLAQGHEQLPVPPPGKFSLRVWNDELYFEYHRGVFTSQAQHKRNMRQSEEQLLNAEKYSSLAWLSGTNYPTTEFTEAWKKVLFNQFHEMGIRLTQVATTRSGARWNQTRAATRCRCSLSQADTHLPRFSRRIGRRRYLSRRAARL